MNQRLYAAASAFTLYSAMMGCTARSGDLRAVSGSISNLQGSGLVLQLNGGNDLAIVAGATSFAFSAQVTEGAMYYVTVLTQPSTPTQTCTVSNGAGTMGDDNVSTVTITCATSSADGGIVDAGSGDAGAVDGGDDAGPDTGDTDAGNGGDAGIGDAGVDAGNSTSEAGAVDAGADAGDSSSGAGTDAGTDAGTVASYFVAVTVSGLSGSGLKFEFSAGDAGTEYLSIAMQDGGSGVGTFNTKFMAGANYEADVNAQPTGPHQTCRFTGIANDGGTYALTDGGIYGVIANDTTLSAACTTNTYSISGSIAAGDGGTLPTSSSIAITIIQTDGGAAIGTADLSTDAGFNYGFTGTDGVAYTIYPSATGYAFTPAYIDLTLDGSAVTEDFFASCESNYYSCTSGCCPKVLSISAGGYHACAVLYGGAIKCWGAGSSGALGDNSNSNSSTPVFTADTTDTYSAIGSGLTHSCGIVTDGTIKCWGYNANGWLGNNSTSTSYVPSLVSDSSNTYTSIALGAGHTCGITSTGLVSCWGYNDNGRLGNNSTSTSWIPVSISDSSSYLSVSAGMYSTCGIVVGGEVKCWGGNSNGQLGNGSTGGTSLVPLAISDSASTYSAISVGNSHVCGVIADAGTVKCWGYNSSGQLGNNSTTSSSVAVTAFDSTNCYSSISAGMYHSCGIITDAGTVKCWGYNSSGQLGNNSTISSTVPVSITDSSESFVSVTTGNNFSCGIVASGWGVKCWGDNSYGQLGNGTTVSSTVPVDVKF